MLGLKNVAAAFELRLIVLCLHENKRHVNIKLDGLGKSQNFPFYESFKFYVLSICE